jgi:FMN-dependent dehydrogenase
LTSSPGRAIEIFGECDLVAASLTLRRIPPCLPAAYYPIVTNTPQNSINRQRVADTKLRFAQRGGKPSRVKKPMRNRSSIRSAAAGGLICRASVAFGQPGVERVLEILRNETRAVMQQVGAPSIKHLIPAMLQRA